MCWIERGDDGDTSVPSAKWSGPIGEVLVDIMVGQSGFFRNPLSPMRRAELSGVNDWRSVRPDSCTRLDVRLLLKATDLALNAERAAAERPAGIAPASSLAGE